MELNDCGVAELDAGELRVVRGGARIWKPSGVTATGEPLYAWVEE